MRFRHSRALKNLTRIGVVLLVFTLLIYWQNNSFHRLLTTPNEAGKYLVVREFIRGLMQNDVHRLKVVTTKTSWSQLDNWVTHHDIVVCRNSLEDRISELLDPSEEMFWGGDGSTSDRREYEKREHLNFVTPCRSSSEVSRLTYSMQIDSLTLIRTLEGWKVENWGCVSEYFLYYDKYTERPPC